MSNSVIPDDIHAFIVQYLDSVAQIEALILLRNDCNKSWQRRELATRLYIAPEEASAVLERLRDAGLLLQSGDAFRYECANSELDAKVGKLVELYRTHLIPVTNLIHLRGVRRIQQFADAFRLRKDKE